MAWKPPVVDPLAWSVNLPEDATAGECTHLGYRHEFQLEGETLRFRWPRPDDPDPPWHTCRVVRVTKGFCDESGTHP
ncbi:MAG: hypothetical protein JO284_17785 [Planctomycetaceae bacterium]|nr:hypothetical protein [Planctomycetaceae bacterium]MBV8228568.1 hypothetical protein [Planctomycetaceae bacterium]MBV8318489.1 hypothetical protein [Planctomycetaceae bacterium]MBV8382678.1 hypothetical protein [Planctomycetaceae bacterium]MBV8606205.1 hypothetical protein [Singulisphaera sp.]